MSLYKRGKTWHTIVVVNGTVDNLRCAKQSLVFLIGCKSQLSKV